MQTLETRIAAEQPVIVLLGKHTEFKNSLLKTFSNKDLDCVYVAFHEIETQRKIISQAYKIIWIQEKPDFSQENPYEKIEKELSQLVMYPEIHRQLLVISPVFTGISSYKEETFSKWKHNFDIQTKYIENLLSQLPTTGFIFIENLLDKTISGTVFEYLLFNQGNKVITSIEDTITVLLEEDSIKAIEELIFIPSKQVSYLLKGAEMETAQLLYSFQKVYEAQKQTELETYIATVKLSNPLPFSVQEKTTESTQMAIVTQLSKVVVEKKIVKEPRSISILTQQIMPPTPPLIYVEKETPVQIQIQTQVQTQTVQPIVQTVQEYKTHLVLPQVSPASFATSKIMNAKNEEDQILTDLQKIFKEERVEKKVRRVVDTTQKSQTVVVKSKNRRVLFYFGIFSVFISSCMVILGAVFFTTQVIFKNQLLEVFSGDRETASATLAKVVGVQTNIYGSLFESSFLLTTDMMVQLSKYIETSPKFVAEARQISENLVLQILTGSFEETSEIAQKSIHKGLEAYEELSQTQALMKQIEFGIDSLQETAFFSTYEKNIQDIRSHISVAQQIQEIIPSLTGVSGKKTYALLLQNDQELRPTGGFIQSVALLNFDRGTLTSYQVYSVYELDQKIAGDIEPPAEIKQYLGESKWYLRDSNWNPDFPIASKQVAWFLDKALNVTVDGVFAITTHGLAEILEVTGPMDIPSHNETLTHKNIAERFEFHSEVILVPTTDKQDYPTTVLTNILKQLTQLQREEALPLAEALYKSLEHRYLQMSVFGQSEQQVLQGLGWTGSLAQPNCPTRLSTVPCIVDVFASVEANVGVNKANYYIERDVKHTVAVSPTEAKHTRIIKMTNTATSNSWPKGSYRLYQRYFLHKNSKLISITVNGKQLNSQEITQSRTGDFSTIGFLTYVPITETVTIQLDYVTNFDGPQSAFSYVFYNQKQSGLLAEPFSIQFSHSPTLSPILIAPSAEINQKQINFTSKNTDEASLFGVQFE